MRSSSSSSARRRMSLVRNKDSRKSSKKLKSKRGFKELAVRIGKGVVMPFKVCYRTIEDHLFIAGLVLFVFLLYALLPSLFWFFVSSSPVIICTGLLLGTLLSFGNPHIPEVNEEPMKAVHDIAPLQVRGIEDDLVLKKEENASDENFSESESESDVSSLEFGQPSKVVASQEDEHPSSKSSMEHEIESREREFGELRDIIGDNLGRIHSSEIHNESDERVRSFVTSSSINDVAGDEIAAQHRLPEYFLENARVHADMLSMENIQKSDAVGVGELEGFKPDSDTYYYTLLKPSDGHDGQSDFASDRSESCSPDASITDINPMLDELCPFISTNHEEDSHIGNSIPRTRANMESSDTESTQAHGSDYGSDELAENMGEDEDEQDDKDAGFVTWTADDEKNVMDLGSSEMERNRRLESLMARRSLRKNLVSQFGNPLDFKSEDTSMLSQLGVHVSSISTKRRNPFDDDSEEISGLPPIPGSAPSVLLRKSNPFDFHDRHFALSTNTVDEYQSILYSESSDLGSTSAYNREEKQSVNLSPYSVPKEKTYNKYQRQLSEINYPRMRSTYKSEPFDPLLNQEYHGELFVRDQHKKREYFSVEQKGASMIEANNQLLSSFENDAWSRMVDEMGSNIHFDVSSTSEIQTIHHDRPELELKPAGMIHYETFTALEKKKEYDGTTVENEESPRLHSDETIESDSSGDSEESSETEQSNVGLDEPVVLPLEISIIPPISSKNKASSEEQHELEHAEGLDNLEKPFGITEMDVMKYVDDHILSELDVVGDFSLASFQHDHDEVEKELQSYSKTEDEGSGIASVMESHACQIKDHLRIQAESSQVEKDLVNIEHGPTQITKGGIHSPVMAIDSDLHEIEARNLDDIDLGLVRHTGIPLDGVLVEGGEHSSVAAIDSDFHEIEARNLNDIDLGLMRHIGVLDDVLLEGGTHSAVTTIDSDMPEIEARNLDDLDLGLMHHTDDVMLEEGVHSVATAIDSDLHEIKARNLDDIDLGLMHHFGVPVDDVFLEVEGGTHSVVTTTDSDLHEIKARNIDDIDLGLLHHAGVTVDDDLLKDILPEPVNYQPGLHEIKVKSLDELHVALGEQQKPDESIIIALKMHETPDQLITSPSKQFDIEGLDLHVIEARSHDELHMASEKCVTPDLPVQDNKESVLLDELAIISTKRHDNEELNLHEIEVGSLTELHEALKKEDGSHEPVEMRAGSFDGLHAAIFNQDNAPYASEVPNVSTDAKVQLSEHGLESKQHDEHSDAEVLASKANEIEEARSTDDNRQGRGEEDLHEIEAQSFADLHAVFGNPINQDKGEEGACLSLSQRNESVDPVDGFERQPPEEYQDTLVEELYVPSNMSEVVVQQISDADALPVKPDPPVDISTIKLDIHEVETRYENLDSTIGQVRTPKALLIQSESEARTVGDIHSNDSQAKYADETHEEVHMD